MDARFLVTKIFTDSDDDDAFCVCPNTFVPDISRPSQEDMKTASKLMDEGKQGRAFEVLGARRLPGGGHLMHGNRVFRWLAERMSDADYVPDEHVTISPGRVHCFKAGYDEKEFTRCVSMGTANELLKIVLKQEPEDGACEIMGWGTKLAQSDHIILRRASVQLRDRTVYEYKIYPASGTKEDHVKAATKLCLLDKEKHLESHPLYYALSDHGHGHMRFHCEERFANFHHDETVQPQFPALMSPLFNALNGKTSAATPGFKLIKEFHINRKSNRPQGERPSQERLKMF